jgi:hypothetical protein
MDKIIEDFANAEIVVDVLIIDGYSDELLDRFAGD